MNLTDVQRNNGATHDTTWTTRDGRHGRLHPPDGQVFRHLQRIQAQRSGGHQEKKTELCSIYTNR